jgi:hypothetical protein
MQRLLDGATPEELNLLTKHARDTALPKEAIDVLIRCKVPVLITQWSVGGEPMVMLPSGVADRLERRHDPAAAAD